MTPAERQLISNLFDRLATLEDAQRDPEAERAIKDGLRQAPNALYALVQTALVQEEALKQAEAPIRQLEQSGGAGAPGRSGSFLDGPFGRPDDRRGSVPERALGRTRRLSARPAANAGTRSQRMPGPAPQPQGSGGGSFLGTAGAALAGAVGGALLANALRGMGGTGGGHGAGGFGLGGQPQGGGMPWGGGTGGPGGAPGGAGSSLPWGGGTGGAGGGALSRDAGIDDIGRAGGGTSGQSGGTSGQGGGNDFFGGGTGGGSAAATVNPTIAPEPRATADTKPQAPRISSESEADDASYEDDADYGSDDADVGGDDPGGDDLGGDDGGTSDQ